MNWVVTIPKKISWSDYLRELDSGDDLFYRVRSFPKDMKVGDRCYITWNGFIRGWMQITGLVVRDGFTCTTTGIHWPAGKYIVRSGLFNPTVPIKMKGFQGIRRLDL